MYHFQALTCAGTESPDMNMTAPVLLHLRCDISTISALLPIPAGTGTHELHSYSFAQFNQPGTTFVLINPCLNSTERHKLSSSCERVSSPSLEEAVVPETYCRWRGTRTKHSEGPAPDQVLLQPQLLGRTPAAGPGRSQNSTGAR